MSGLYEMLQERDVRGILIPPHSAYRLSTFRYEVNGVQSKISRLGYPV